MRLDFDDDHHRVLSKDAELSGGLSRVEMCVGHTPLVDVQLRVGRRRGRIRLKLESFNPFGSIKDRTALFLYSSVEPSLHPKSGLIESTSGNLGVALAAIARSRGVPFTAVVDPRANQLAIARMKHFGAHTVTVRSPDGRGGYLLSRLDEVARLLARDPGLTTNLRLSRVYRLCNRGGFLCHRYITQPGAPTS